MFHVMVPAEALYTPPPYTFYNKVRRYILHNLHARGIHRTIVSVVENVGECVARVAIGNAVFMAR